MLAIDPLYFASQQFFQKNNVGKEKRNDEPNETRDACFPRCSKLEVFSKIV